MTNHRLTDEICYNIAPWSVQSPCGHTNMRSAADWQLEQVKAKVKRKLRVWRRSGYDFAADVVEDFFKEVMQTWKI